MQLKGWLEVEKSCWCCCLMSIVEIVVEVCWSWYYLSISLTFCRHKLLIFVTVFVQNPQEVLQNLNLGPSVVLTRRRRQQDEVPEGQGTQGTAPTRQRLQPHDEQALWILQSKAAAQLQYTWYTNEAYVYMQWTYGKMGILWEYNADSQIIYSVGIEWIHICVQTLKLTEA